MGSKALILWWSIENEHGRNTVYYMRKDVGMVIGFCVIEWGWNYNERSSYFHFKLRNSNLKWLVYQFSTSGWILRLSIVITSSIIISQIISHEGQLSWSIVELSLFHFDTFISIHQRILSWVKISTWRTIVMNFDAFINIYQHLKLGEDLTFCQTIK